VLPHKKIYSPKIRKAQLRGLSCASSCASIFLLLTGIRLLKYSTEQTGKYAEEWMFLGAFVSVFAAAGVMWSLKLYASMRALEQKNQDFRATAQMVRADPTKTDIKKGQWTQLHSHRYRSAPSIRRN
jgi:hypothetical protein